MFVLLHLGLKTDNHICQRHECEEFKSQNQDLVGMMDPSSFVVRPDGRKLESLCCGLLHENGNC